jgi:hypothetical protein
MYENKKIFTTIDPQISKYYMETFCSRHLKYAYPEMLQKPSKSLPCIAKIFSINTKFLYPRNSNKNDLKTTKNDSEKGHPRNPLNYIRAAWVCQNCTPAIIRPDSSLPAAAATYRA